MQDQELNKAFLKSIKTYFNDHDLMEKSKTEKDRKYNKKYFDGIQKELAPDSKFYGKQEEEKKPAKKKAKTNGSY